jgi:hypothetical protein
MNLSSAALRIQALDFEPIWVAWQLQDGRKLPIDPRTGYGAKANDSATWGTRRAAEARAGVLPKPQGLGGVGPQLGPLAGGKVWLGGIDLDTCRDPATGALDAWALATLAALDSYSEVSPSGTGVKTFFLIEAADVPAIRAAMGGDGTKYGCTFKCGNGAAHPPGIEVYIGKRYFAFTDMMLTESTLELRRVPRAVLLDLLERAGPAFQAAGEGSPQKEIVSSGTRGGTGAGALRSGEALKLAIKRTAAGDTDAQIYAALADDPETASWLREKGDLYDRREFKRTCAAARAFLTAQTDGHEFDCEPLPVAGAVA